MYNELLALADWRRRVAELYATVRAAPEPEAAWSTWAQARDDLFRNHPQSPIPEEERQGFSGLTYFSYDPAARVLGAVKDASIERYDVATSGDGTIAFTRFAEVTFDWKDRTAALELYWLEGYAGGVFLPFRDGTSGATTYGACRYLLDTVKGADLGMHGEKIVLDFNFAYNPSCSYDARWVCPLAPPPNRLDFPIEAGERTS